MRSRAASKQGIESDVIIAGGGPVGLTLALALKRSTPGLDVLLVDAAGERSDDRASAVAAAARRMLAALGVWDEMAGAAQPIEQMIITDSRTGDTVRPVFLTFDGAVEDGEPFAWMVPNTALGSALRAASEAAGVRFATPATVADFETGEAAVAVRFEDGRTRRAALLVACDGGRSRLRAMAGIRTVGWSYRQWGIVATAAHERPHHGRAEEHFLPAGPFAILPLRPDGGVSRSSLVWTEPEAVARRLLGSEAETFAAELARRFGHHLGWLRPAGGRHGFPLGLMLARDFVRPRFALCGDAAHTIHPIAGQGLNLGLRDAAALTETVVEAARLGLDIGALTVLERYQRWRRFDTLEMALVTDGLNRLFSNDNPALRLVRDIGLGLVDRLPPLKRMLIGQAAGMGSDLPRLLRGRPV